MRRYSSSRSMSLRTSRRPSPTPSSSPITCARAGKAAASIVTSKQLMLWESSGDASVAESSARSPEQRLRLTADRERERILKHAQVQVEHALKLVQVPAANRGRLTA